MIITRDMLLRACEDDTYYWSLVYAICYHYDLTTDNAERWLYWRGQNELAHPTRQGRVLA